MTTGEIERWSAPKVWLFSLFNRDPKSNRVAIEHLAPGPGDRVLDLGCGLGAALAAAQNAGAEVAGIDPSPSMVERAKSRLPGAEIVVGSAEKIPFPDDSFTGAVAIATYHHWADHSAGLAEARRVLAPGGRLLIVEGKLKRSKGHGLHPDEAEGLAARLGRLGFEDAAVVHLRAGRHRYVGVSAIKPSPRPAGD